MAQPTDKALQKLKFQDDGVTYLQVGLSLTVFWTGSVHDRAEGVLDFYDQCLALIRPALTFYETGEMDGAAPITPEALRVLPEWLAHPDPDQDILILRLETGRDRDEVTDTAFEFRAIAATDADSDEDDDDDDADETDDDDDETDDEAPGVPTGVLRLTLPPAFIAESPDRFVELTTRLVRKLPFTSGLAGYTLNWHEWGVYRDEAERRLYALGRRYLGLDLGELTLTMDLIPHGIKGVNWLTLLSPDLAAQVQPEVEAHTSPAGSLVVTPLATGTLIRATPGPLLGDVNKQEPMDGYFTAGRCLRSIRSEEPVAFIVHRGDSDETATAEWLARFDDEG